MAMLTVSEEGCVCVYVVCMYVCVSVNELPHNLRVYLGIAVFLFSSLIRIRYGSMMIIFAAVVMGW